MLPPKRSSDIAQAFRQFRQFPKTQFLPLLDCYREHPSEIHSNILAGEILITALLGLCAWGLPLPIMFFEILVACVQALVFTMLTTVYIATAVNDEH